MKKNDLAAGGVYNIGGGPGNVKSVWAEFGPLLEKLLGKGIMVARDDWRPGDQKVFYADIRKVERELSYPRCLPEISKGSDRRVRSLYLFDIRPGGGRDVL